MNNLMALGYTNNIPGTVEGKRLSSGVVERSKIESFLVRIQLLVGFGLFHQLIAVTYAAIGETSRSVLNKVVVV